MNLKILYQWTNEIARHFQCLNTWQVVNLALFSFAEALAGSCQQTAIARQAACGEMVASTVKRLQRFIGNENWCDKRFFVELATWVLSKVKADRLYLLVDETKLKDRLGIMMIGLAFEGRCIPLVWRCYKANSSKDYPVEGQIGMIVAMLELIQEAMPADKEALVLADRGIGTSPQLCQKLGAMGLKYLFRISKQSKMMRADRKWESIYDQVRSGEVWQSSGIVFKKRGRIPAHVRAIWEANCDEPWLLITNDARVSGYEYALRNWQEQSFRDLKSGGWNWLQSRIRCPQRMTRFLAILALAYAWMISAGCHAVAQNCASTLITDSKGRRRRKWSLFKEGLQFFKDYVIRRELWLPFNLIADKRLC